MLGIMAKMIPKNIHNYNFTQSEKFVYDQLKEQLDDSIIVFYSVSWNQKSMKDGKILKSECDFLIFYPQIGYITLEVKGGKGLEIVDNEWTLLLDEMVENNPEDRDVAKRTLRRSPFKQAEESCYFFKNYYEQSFNRPFRGVYGYGVCFPYFNVDGDLGPEGPVEIIIDQQDMDNLPKAINRIFRYWKNKQFLFLSPEEQSRFLTLISKRVTLSATLGSVIKTRQQLFRNVNRVQDIFLDMIANYKQAYILGPAGTGKTWIAIKKAQRLAAKNKKVLFVCFNSSLAAFVNSLFKDTTNVDCFTFHGLIKHIVGEYEYSKLHKKDITLTGVSDVVYRLGRSTTYDAILIDEAQDFTEEWALTLKLLLKDERDSLLYVFLDPEQNIFGRDFKRAFDISHPPFLLTENLRNTAEIYEFTVKETGLGATAKLNTIEGVAPQVYSFTTDKEAIKKVRGLVHELLNVEGIDNKALTILSDRALENSLLNGKRQLGNYTLVTDGKYHDELGRNEILYKTVQAFKGLESDVVIYLEHDIDFRDNKRKAQSYVAYSRARFLLYVIRFHGNMSKKGRTQGMLPFSP